MGRGRATQHRKGQLCRSLGPGPPSRQPASRAPGGRSPRLIAAVLFSPGSTWLRSSREGRLPVPAPGTAPPPASVPAHLPATSEVQMSLWPQRAAWWLTSNKGGGRCYPSQTPAPKLGATKPPAPREAESGPGVPSPGCGSHSRRPLPPHSLAQLCLQWVPAEKPSPHTSTASSHRLSAQEPPTHSVTRAPDDGGQGAWMAHLGTRTPPQRWSVALNKEP